MVACHQAKVPENQCMTLILLLSVDESAGDRDLSFLGFHKLPNDGCQAPHKDQRMVTCHQAKVPENQCMTLISLLSVDESRG